MPVTLMAAPASGATAAGFLLSDHSGRAPAVEICMAANRELANSEAPVARRDCPRVRFVKIDIDSRSEPARFLLRVHPVVRPH
jgi:hypothetical protein